jgi:3-phenylpropionate/trans-cinnamate dioxygenase ferredoxin reductase subunit
MIGKLEAFDSVPFFYSDQYELSLIYRGSAPSWDRVVISGTPESGSFSAFYLKGRRVLAVCSVNRQAESAAAMQLLGHEIDDAMLMRDQWHLSNVM